MTPDLFAKYDVPVPRYTSYPTVPEWKTQPTTDDWLQSLERALTGADPSVSLYMHLPFCESLCTLCGCNTVITRDHGRARPYVDLILKELGLYAARVPALVRQPISEMHFGGGTPTFLTPDELDVLLTGTFEILTRDARHFEGSVEADPRVTTVAHLDLLRRHGFTAPLARRPGLRQTTSSSSSTASSRSTLTARLMRHARESGDTSR